MSALCLSGMDAGEGAGTKSALATSTVIEEPCYSLRLTCLCSQAFGCHSFVPSSAASADAFQLVRCWIGSLWARSLALESWWLQKLFFSGCTTLLWNKSLKVIVWHWNKGQFCNSAKYWGGKEDLTWGQNNLLFQVSSEKRSIFPLGVLLAKMSSSHGMQVTMGARRDTLG